MAFDESLNTRHISTNLAAYEAARSNFFVFVVYDLDNLLKINYTGEADAATENDKIQHAADYIRLNVTKCAMQDFTLQQAEYRRGNDVVKFPTIPTFGDGSITVDDVIGLDTKSILHAWLHLAYNPNTRKMGRMSSYKKNCDMIEYSADYTEIRRWHLEGCWVSAITNDDFDKEDDGGKRSMQATIIYDRAVMETPQ